MLTTLLCILFSDTLNFDGLTLQSLFQWYNNHPFLFMLVVAEVVNMFNCKKEQ